ncbi:metal-dependent hydrolase [Veronia nyctiphanis]|uniref:Metal-dependent hydrolase n=1 Tax=Veronia nyctiphanis TaxID=1278244 RepID=A0A4Q0YLN9_9GAMM|nr:alanyl-tRNA editing protein [Veronia nyctiphanis]RXJ71717.1 metal-dependent hydrolase [Veronia nyctiphanis]
MKQVTATKITFTHPQWDVDSKVQICERCDRGVRLVTEVTPFHPVSHIWPDHPADRGYVDIKGKSYAIADCLTGAYHTETAELFVDKDIPVKRDTPGWLFVVVHTIDSEDEFEVGEHVRLDVDKPYQASLSRGHSAAHFAALALNKVIHSDYWRKEAQRKDPLDHHDFHAYAEQTSFVTEDRCEDTYRLGKTLRKRGLNSAELLANLADIEDKVNQQLAQWKAYGAEIIMKRHGEYLTDSRYWCCEIDEQKIEIPCGGTHISSLQDLDTLKVVLSSDSEQEIKMTTLTSPALNT